MCTGLHIIHDNVLGFLRHIWYLGWTKDHFNLCFIFSLLSTNSWALLTLQIQKSSMRPKKKFSLALCCLFYVKYTLFFYWLNCIFLVIPVNTNSLFRNFTPCRGIINQMAQSRMFIYAHTGVKVFRFIT